MTMSRLGVLGAALGFLIASAASVLAAADINVYEPGAFTAAQSDQKHIVVEVFKKGCGTCAAQQPSLAAARENYPDAVFMKIDFQGDEKAVEKFRIAKQSTIIVFKGKDEVARLVGETDRDAILGAIAKGV